MAGRPPGDSADGRVRLLDACWSLLLENEPGERITIAAVCERARCTPPTLYHHFGDLSALEEAASARAFEAWSASVSDRYASVPDPRERLHVHGRAYLEWATENADAYYVLFNRPGKLPSDGSAPSFPDIMEILAAIHDRRPDDPSIYAMGFAFFSAVHGLANLAIAGDGIPVEAYFTTLKYFESTFNDHGPPEPQEWAVDLLSRNPPEPPSKPRSRRMRF